MKKYYYVYILVCLDKSYYVGMTDDLHRRLWEHNEGIYEDSYIYTRRPVILLYTEEYEEMNDALMREKQLKGWSRDKKIALIEEKSSELHSLSNCKNITHYKNYNPS